MTVTQRGDDETVARSETPAPRHDALERFTPGTLVADRYRIIALLGQGGMGEVYRADDVRLGQRVALKYLPERLSNDAAALARLLHEVRVGRTISHPNVCRMYDIVETEGHRFIAMEYVDGEDLASLLRRIGRLPSGKGVAIARDICAGLAAAHEKGVIHRDLKPANIMIDGRGSARITDFGLAWVASDATASGSDQAGTPAYMAPEQLAGSALTPRSDIYSLGLVLYEIFTGKRVFDSNTRDDLRKQHLMSKTRPSALTNDIDPAVERLILRCLDEDPSQRPSSMHAVMAALPGGDPLQAAIAAGETPSPQMVAAAGETRELTSLGGWLLFGVFLSALAAAGWLSDRATLTGFIPGIRSRDILADRARSILGTLGYAAGRDSGSWYLTDRPYLQWRAAHVEASDRWRELPSAQPSPVNFEYRDRPDTLATRLPLAPVSRYDPAPVQPGDADVIIDHEGRLLRFQRVPELQPPATKEVDWRPAFAAAGLDEALFQPAAPSLPPPVGSDRRYAWKAGDVSVEAASYGNRPVYFAVRRPWQIGASVPTRSVGGVTFAVTGFLAIIAAAVIARRNAVRGRVDFRGVRRLAMWTTTLFFIHGLLVAHHVTEPYLEYEILVVNLGVALYDGLFAATLYAATEPYVRRRWPHILVGWSRMVAGRVRDPQIGYEVLIGIAMGAVIVSIARAALLVGVHAGAALPPNPLTTPVANVTFAGAATLTFSLPQAVLFALAGLILLLLFRLVSRSTAAAIVGTAIVNALVSTGISATLDFVSGLIIGGILMWLIFRFGVLTAGTATFVNFTFRAAPLTLRFGESYASTVLTMVVVVLIGAAAAFYTGLAGKPLFGAITAEEEATSSA